MTQRLLPVPIPPHAVAVRDLLRVAPQPGVTLASLWASLAPAWVPSLVTAGLWHWRFRDRLQAANVNGILHYTWRD